MNSRLNFMAIAACCAVLSGCDWGGVSDEENWSDAYSWLNFSGTYLLQNAIADTSSDSESESETTQPTITTEQVSGSAKGNIAAKGKGTTINLSPVGKGVVPGTVSVVVKVGGSNPMSFADDGSGNLTSSGSASGTVQYETGTVTISKSSSFHTTLDSPVSVTYKYNVEGVVPGSSSSSKKSSSEASIIYLTVNQKGNTFTMKDNNGISYSGRITGTSCTSDSYKVAGDKTISFEVSGSNNSTIVGSFTGTTTAANSESTVTVNNRRVSGTYRRGKNSANFAGSAK